MSEIKLLSELTDRKKETSVKILNISQELILASIRSMKFGDMCKCMQKYYMIDILFAQRLLDELDINELKNKAKHEKLSELTESLDILDKLNRKTAADILNAADKNFLAQSINNELFEKPPAGISMILYRLSKISPEAAKEIYGLINIQKIADYIKRFNSQECLCKHLHYLSSIDCGKTKELTKYLDLEALFYETNDQPLIYIAAILSMLTDIEYNLAAALFDKYGAERLAAKASQESGNSLFETNQITLDEFIKKIY